MISAIFLLLMSSAVLTLRLGSGTGSFPRPLNAQEEREYVERSAKGDLEARNKLIEHNLRLVAHIMKKYYTQTKDQGDLISIGTIGLIKGISTYNPEKGVKLATYASRCIENEILMHFRSQKKSAGVVSLSDTIESGGDGNSLSLIDVIASPEDMFEDISSKEIYEKLRKCVADRLSEREATIISMRYGLNNELPKTQREIAGICGISRSYVSRIEKRALKKLEDALGNEI